MKQELKKFDPHEIPLWEKVSRFDQELIAGTVQVWKYDFLSCTPDQLSDFRIILSEEELNKADRHVFIHDRQRSILSRALLRCLLASHWGCDPVDLVFDYSEQGKPRLASHPNSLFSLEFNLSHTSQSVVVACSRDIVLGIDLESIEDRRSMEEISQRYFHPQEAAYLQSLSSQDHREMAYRYWVLKEAYLKAKGVGLSGHLDDWPLPPDLTFMDNLISREGQERWSLRLLPGLKNDEVGALVANSDNYSLRLFELAAFP